MIAATRNQRVVQSGNPSAGLNCESPCPNAHTAPAYNTPARSTLRRFNSAKKEGLAVIAVVVLVRQDERIGEQPADARIARGPGAIQPLEQVVRILAQTIDLGDLVR